MVDSNGIVAPTLSATAGPLLKMRDVCKRFNLHPNTVRKAADSQTLSAFILPSGHRRFSIEAIERWLNVAVETGNDNGANASGTIPVALVARVSSSKQAAARGESTESDLDRQCRRLREYAATRWGKGCKTTEYVSVGSGLNFSRPELLKLISDILAGKYANGFIVATYKDRVARFGIEMIETICRVGNCQLVFTEAEPTKEVYETIAEDVLGIITHFTAKASGMKARKALKVIIPPDVLQDCYNWKREGYTNKQIEARLKREGRGKDEKGRPISHQIIQKTLAENLTMMQALGANDTIDPHSFATFYKQCVKAGDDSARLVKVDMMEAYRLWADRQSLPVLSGIAVGKWMKRQGTATVFNRAGNLAYVGLKLAQ